MMHRMHRMHRARAHREAGSATVFVIGFALVLVAFAGLVVDGGLALNARQRVSDDVEQAARAGAQNLDLDRLRNDGVVVIDPGKAADAANNFLAVRGYPRDRIEVDANAEQVTVRATIVRPTVLLSLININQYTITAAGQARPTVGIDGGAP
jgi:Flp pilus assembly protein TadG